MPTIESLFNAFVTVLVTIDPPGLAPLFLALTRGMNRSERAQVALRASVIGFAVPSSNPTANRPAAPMDKAG